MKLNKLLYIIAAVSMSMMFACSGMNDSIDPYLSRGEIVYIAKSDSVNLFAGNRRFKLDFWMSDPRATEMRIYWSQRADSVVIPIDEQSHGKRIEVEIGGAQKPMEEGNYTLELVTFDRYGNKSIVDEYIVNVYAAFFESMVLPKFIKSATYQAAAGSVPESVKIVWGGSTSEREIGVNIKYTAIDGDNKTEYYTSAQLKNEMSLTDANLSKDITYQTLYLPEAMAIDTFMTAYLPIPIEGLPD